ncbi:MAG: flavin reductase [Phycisphaerales bacterium]|nr:flavin reductase [Phycisphaerales bacterium]
MADAPEWARALGRVPSGLFIVTAGTADDATGFLASWVQQVGLEPASLSVAIKQGRHVGRLIRDHGTFCVSILDSESKDLLGHFARGFAPGDPAFVGIDTATTDCGVPFLTGALAHRVCRFVDAVDWADHSIVCGEVVGGRPHREGDPIVHLRKHGQTY